jgi:hypothetical protein
LSRVRQDLERTEKIFTALERARTPVEKLLPQMPMMMASGASGREASELLNIAAEFAPGEEGTYASATLKALRETRLKGKGGELGLKDGMSPVEQIKAAALKIDERVRGGEGEEDILKDYFGDVREFRGMQGFLNRGLRAGRFDAVESMIGETSPIKIQSELAKWEGSTGGRRAGVLADESVQRAIRGAEVADAAEERQRARNELISEGRFEAGNETAGDIVRQMFNFGGVFGSKEEHATELRTYQNVLRRSGRDVEEDFGAALPSSVLASETQKVLEQIRDTNEKMAAENAGPRPLRAPSPRIARAPGG